MPAATNQAELLKITERDFTKLTRLLDPISEGTAIAKNDDDTSIKDIIGHRAHWISLFLGWYRDGQEGKDVHFPAPGYKWNMLKLYNAKIREDQQNLSWEQARQLLEENHAHLLAFIQQKNDAALYGGPMKGANNDWTPGRWAEAAGASHYRSAAKAIRAMLKAVN